MKVVSHEERNTDAVVRICNAIVQLAQDLYKSTHIAASLLMKTCKEIEVRIELEECESAPKRMIYQRDRSVCGVHGPDDSYAGRNSKHSSSCKWYCSITVLEQVH